MRGSFFGGVHPVTRKELTRRKHLTQLDRPPEQVAIPLRMSAGEESVPLVKPGDLVEVGQPIAGPGPGGAAVHASVSGRVSAIREQPHPWGGQSVAVVIRNDGQDTPWSGRPEPVILEEVTLDLLLDRVREAGVVGMGGGAAPTVQKLEQAAGKVDTVIINGAECEPYVTADHRLLLERSDQILQVTQVLARCLGAHRAVVVTEGDKLNAAEVIERRLRKRGGKVELRTLRTRYPLGGEKQIIQTVTGREVPLGKAAWEEKCLVLNVATVFAIQEALVKGKALTHRAVTVTGGAVVRPRNLWVPIGTPLRVLLESAGGLRERPELILTGGPMMGVAQEDLEAPVVKKTNCVVCLTQEERRRAGPEGVCIRCGKCVAACPMHLAPMFIARALRQREWRQLDRLHVEDCISCGCCSYICPAQIPLVDLVRQAAEHVGKGVDSHGA